MSQEPVLAELGLPPHEMGRVWIHGSPRGGSPFHRHAELELNLALSGHATYLVGQERLKLSRRSLLWLHPAQNHILIQASPDFSMGIAVWKPEFLRRACQGESSQLLLQDSPPEARLRRVGEDDFALLEILSRALSEASGEPLEWGLGFLLHRAQCAFERAPQSGEAGVVHPCVERAARILRDQAPPPSLPVLARQVGLSPSRLSRLFKTQTGVSLGEFRARQCHERALRLLENRDLSLAQIAQRAGFGSYAQFHRTFCARSGDNPARVRKRN